VDEKKKGEIPPGPPFQRGERKSPFSKGEKKSPFSKGEKRVPFAKKGERSPPLKKGDLGGFQSFLTKWEMKFSLVLW
jgi:hypothetical protein